MSAVLTRRIEDILHHMDHTICCHQVAVWHIHRVDMNRVVNLGKTEKKVKQCIHIYLSRVSINTFLFYEVMV